MKIFADYVSKAIQCKLKKNSNLIKKKKKSFRPIMNFFVTFININYKTLFFGDTALHIACYHGHIDIIKLLLEIPEIDVCAKNYNNQNALEIICNNHYAHYLYDKNMIKIADILLQFSVINWNNSIIIKCRCALHLQIDKMIKKHISKTLIGIIPLPHDIIYTIVTLL